MIRELVKKMANVVVGDYAIFDVYAWEAARDIDFPLGNVTIRSVTKEELAECSDPVLRQRACYGGDGAEGYGAFLDGKLVGVCWFWYGERYKTRDFWPLGAFEAKLVEIVVTPGSRGYGVGSKLWLTGAIRMSERGFQRLYARIWHSNRASIRSCTNAGWYKVARVVELHPLGRKKPWRFVRRCFKHLPVAEVDSASRLPFYADSDERY